MAKFGLKIVTDDSVPDVEIATGNTMIGMLASLAHEAEAFIGDDHSRWVNIQLSADGKWEKVFAIYLHTD